MEKYTIEDLVQMTNLTDKTIRNYIKLKILNGTKLNNKWFFTEADCLNFFQNEIVKHSIEAKSLGIMLDALNNSNNMFTNIFYLDKAKVNFKLLKEQLQSLTDFVFKLDLKQDKYRIIFQANPTTNLIFLNAIKDYL